MMRQQERMMDLISQVDNLFSGTPWFGPSWMETLEKIPSDAFTFKLESGASIGGLLGHVVAWREYVAQKLQGQEDFDLLPGADWPKEPSDDSEWQELVRKMVDLQQELMEGLSDLPSAHLDESVPGREFSWAFMIQGIIDHDVYHLGQINLLLKQVLPTP